MKQALALTPSAIPAHYMTDEEMYGSDLEAMTEAARVAALRGAYARLAGEGEFEYLYDRGYWF